MYISGGYNCQFFGNLCVSTTQSPFAYSKLTIEKLEQRVTPFSSVSIVNFEHIIAGERSRFILHLRSEAPMKSFHSVVRLEIFPYFPLLHEAKVLSSLLAQNEVFQGL